MASGLNAQGKCLQYQPVLISARLPWMSGGKSLDQQALSPLIGLGNQSERLSTEHIIFPSLG